MGGNGSIITIKEHDRVVLLKDVTDEGLKAGDVGTVVHVYRHGEAFEVEFMTVSNKAGEAPVDILVGCI